MTNEEIFNSVMIDWGFGTRLERIEGDGNAFDYFTNRAQRYIDSAQAALPDMPRIHFDWIHNESLNAFAFRAENQYFIGVTDASLFIIQVLFYRMLADSRFLPHIGNPAEESVLDPLPLWSDSAQDLYSAGIEIVLPQNPDRRLYANHLIQTFIDFMVGHELTHIVRGHVSLYQDKFNLSVLPENSLWVKGEQQPPISRQTMEMDADSGAVCNAIGTIRDRLAGKVPTPPPFNQFYQTPDASLFNWSVSVSMFFRLFGDESFSNDDVTTHYYPPIRVRNYMAMGTATSYIIERWDKDLGQIAAKAILEGQKVTEEVFTLMTCTTISSEALKEVWTKTGFEYFSQLEEYWKAILRPELLPYAYGNLPD